MIELYNAYPFKEKFFDSRPSKVDGHDKAFGGRGFILAADYFWRK